jgi:hypothetical protein
MYTSILYKNRLTVYIECSDHCGEKQLARIIDDAMLGSLSTFMNGENQKGVKDALIMDE